jgi:hypothetical protein
MAIPDERKSSPLYPNSNRRKSTGLALQGFCYAAVQRSAKFVKPISWVFEIVFGQ